MTCAKDQPDPRVGAVQEALQDGNRGNQYVRGWGDDVARRAVKALDRYTEVHESSSELAEAGAEEASPEDYGE